MITVGFKGGTMNILSLENFQDHEIICVKLSWWTHVIKHLSRGMECTFLKEEHMGKLESLLFTIYCPCRFICGNKCSLWWGKLSREIVPMWNNRYMGNSQFCYETKPCTSWYWWMQAEYFLEYIIWERWICFYLQFFLSHYTIKMWENRAL